MKIKRKLTCLLIVAAWFTSFSTSVSASSTKDFIFRPASSAGQVTNLINQYRQQNGLAPLETNALLSSLAQGQSDYQASINTVTHTGPDGSTPQDRAASAGYGGGSFFYLSEIIYGGSNQTASDALLWWKNSSLHNSIMLDSKYSEIGAGVATNGEYVYYTAVLGGPTDDASTGNGDSDDEDPQNNQSSTPLSNYTIAIPVQISTPQPDGSIVHTVQPGQTLWTIAAVYEIELNTLLEMNNLNSYSFVFPGDQLIIQPANVKTPLETTNSITLTPTENFPEQPLATKEVIGVPFSAQVDTPTTISTLMATSEPASSIFPNQNEPGLFSDNSIARYFVIGAFIILIAVIASSMFFQKSQPSQVEEEIS